MWLNAAASSEQGRSIRSARLKSLPAKRVLVGTALDAASAIALVRGAGVARALDADLHVIHVIPGPPATSAWSLGTALDDTRTMSPEVKDALEATHGFVVTNLLCHFFPRDRLLVREGHVAECIQRAADHLDAAYVVLGEPDTRKDRASVVREIVRGASRPVLVARAPAQSNRIVAATDFSDEGFPALTQASALAALLHAPLTFVHNLDPLAAFAASSTFALPPALLGTSLHDAAERRTLCLRHVAEALGAEAETRFMMRQSSVDAILEVARERDADLIVVGSHGGSGVRRRSAGIAEALVQVAGRCVLVVPLRPERGADSHL
jgi:nucleotide-binding universal stress UspA family protein